MTDVQQQAVEKKFSVDTACMGVVSDAHWRDLYCMVLASRHEWWREYAILSSMNGFAMGWQ